MIRSSCKSRIPSVAFGLIAILLAGCGAFDDAPGTDAHAPADEASPEAAKGPHGGRLLVDAGFALEVTIFERGVPPEFRLYPMLEGQPIAPSQVKATIELSRVNGLPGGRTDRHLFSARDDYLVSAAEVYEPHSFSVKVEATHAGRSYRWTYDSPEGRVRIDPDIAAAQGLRTASADRGVIAERAALYGTIAPDPRRQHRIAARYPGLVRSVAVQIGEVVEAGQTLATIESNESLQVYAVTAPGAGLVTGRNVNPGEVVTGATLFEVSDLSRVWAQLSVFARDRQRMKPGQPVRLEAIDGGASTAGTLDYISPLGTAEQTVSARVMVDNSLGRWAPGQFVTATVTLGDTPAALVVPLSALQRFRDWDVVFVVQDDVYQAQPVELGSRDAQVVEVLGGLEPGARIVVANSYLVKADIEKSGATHDH